MDFLAKISTASAGTNWRKNADGHQHTYQQKEEERRSEEKKQPGKEDTCKERKITACGQN
jgi:hypothetical protein